VPLALSALLVAGCMDAAAPAADVEGTVQARVNATVQALNRTAATATRPPLTTALASVTAGTAGASTATRAASPGATASVSPANTVGTAVASPSGGTATPAGTPRPGTTPSPALGTAAPSPTGSLSFGGVARIGGMAVTLSRYEWGYTCPAAGDNGVPGAGLKFVTVYASGRDDSAAPVNVPPIQWSLEGYPAETAQSSCRQDDQAFAVACRAGSRLAQDARCEGWVLFKVPDGLDVTGSLVQAQGAGTAQWRIPG
jgi:hypothetical protein